MNKKAIIFLILFIISFFASLFFNAKEIKIPYLKGLYKEIQLDIIFKNSTSKIFFDNKEIKNHIKIDENHYLYKTKNTQPIKKISFDNSKNIEKGMIYIGNEIQFINSDINEYKINNNKTLLDKCIISFLSFFYNPQFYIVSYIFLFLFLYNFKFNIKTKNILILLISLGFILKTAQINNIPFWDDEIFVLRATAPYSNLIELFNDPGNPPLYFILFKIYRTIVNNPEFYRFSSVILGIIFNICFYIYVKSTFGKKSALIGLSFITINIILIYFSQEIRCYMLLALLAIICQYFLFKFNKKTRFYYLFSTIAILYTHFYASFLVLYNFIFGLSIFKNKTKIKSFIIVNLIAFLSYIPLLIQKKSSITSAFNSWIGIPNFESYILTINTLFGSIFMMGTILLTLIYLYRKTTSKNKLFIKYNIFCIGFVILCAILVSYLIKPIYCYRYFYIVYPCVLALISYIFGCFLNKKTGYILIFLFIPLLNFRLNEQNLFCNHNLFLNFVQHDIDISKNNYILMSDTTKGYKEFEIQNAKMLYLPVNQGIKVFEFEKYNIEKPSVIYLLNFYLDDYTLKNAKNIELYKSPLGVFCKIEL